MGDYPSGEVIPRDVQSTPAVPDRAPVRNARSIRMGEPEVDRVQRSEADVD